MEYKRCEKGHFYDPSIYSTCPTCAAEANQQAAGMDTIGETMPIGATEPIDNSMNATVGPTEPIYSSGMAGGQTVGDTMPVTNPGFTPTDFASNSWQSGYPNNNPNVQNYEPTQPMPIDNTAGFSPVTGWLVCIDGPEKGKDYRIHNGNNYIGRAQEMDICIENDNHISNVNAGVLGFDEIENLFFFGPAGGRNTVRVNGKMVINAVELAPYDRIKIGTTELMFVPLCGEKFSWNRESKA